MPLDTRNNIADVAGDLLHIYRKIEGEEFEGVFAQRVWLSYELANVYATLAVTNFQNSSPHDMDVESAIEWIETASRHHQSYDGRYNKNNAKWLRDEFIVDNLKLLKSLLIAEFKDGDTSVVYRELSCDFYEFELYVLLDDPLFIRNGGVEYVENHCPNI